jgi:dihydrolipoamide dehydrogenase
MTSSTTSRRAPPTRASPVHRFDLAIVGGGPGGYVAAIRAAQLGMSVAVVEREALGGVCLNWGCIPAKALLRSAEVANLARRGPEFGVRYEGVSFDLGAAVDRSRGVVDQVVRGVEYLMDQHTVTVFRGSASLSAATRLEVTPSGERIEATNVILATGGRARSFWPVDGQRVMTSREAMARRDLPRSVVIIGGGCVGLEFADVYNAFGAEVALLERSERILDDGEPETSAALSEALRRRGVRIVTDTHVDELHVDGDGVAITIDSDDGHEVVRAESALAAVGIEPNSAGLGLEEAGVALDGRGYVQTDDFGRSSVAGVWAIGDVTGKMQLAHVASAQGVLAVETIAGLNPAPLDYDWMPKVVYTSPQVAMIGLNETAAREQHEVRVGRFPYAASGRAATMGNSEGFAKLISDANTGELLGFHAVGPEAGELLGEIGVARTLESTPLEIGRTVHAHPTFGEVAREAALAATGEAIHYVSRSRARASEASGS